MSKSSLEGRSVSLRTALTPEERVFFWKFGAAVALQDRGVRPSEFDATVGWDASLEKRAAGGMRLVGRVLSPIALSKGVVVSSLLAGVPLGIVWHAAARRARSQRNTERDIEKQIDYYSDASRHLEHSLVGAGL